MTARPIQLSDAAFLMLRKSIGNLDTEVALPVRADDMLAAAELVDAEYATVSDADSRIDLRATPAGLKYMKMIDTLLKDRGVIVATPEAFPESVLARIQEVADSHPEVEAATGGGLADEIGQRAMSTAELTDEEMDLIRSAKTPVEHDYNYEEDPKPTQRTPDQSPKPL